LSRRGSEILIACHESNRDQLAARLAGQRHHDAERRVKIRIAQGGYEESPGRFGRAWGDVERRILPQDRLLEPTKRWSGLEAET
jgi:hypothetical protein